MACGEPISTLSPPASVGCVPEHAYAGDVPLTAATRGDHVEAVHRGTIAVATASGEILWQAGDSAQPTYMRSSAKPFQAMALIFTGAADALHLNDEDLAIACSSHSGESRHVEAVRRLLEKGNVPEPALRCGVHAPLFTPAAHRLIESGETPSQLHNNCSGKHAAMLVACVHMGWPLDTYLDVAHPLQQLNLGTVAVFTGMAPEDIDTAVDGCGVPVFYVPVSGVAVAFARLAVGISIPESHASAAGRIRRAMMAYPHLVAGTHRFDTQLMEAGRGSIVCKGGAMGGEGIGLLKQGLGIGMKISDGSSGSIGVAAMHVLDGLDALDEAADESLTDIARPVLRNHAGTAVGTLEPTFEVGGLAR